MKKFSLVLACLLVASFSFAGETKKADAPKGKTHEVQTEIVSVDATGKTVTVKGEKGEMKVACMGKAVSQLKTVKAGDKVTLMCQDNEKGDHMGVTEISASKPPAK